MIVLISLSVVGLKKQIPEIGIILKANGGYSEVTLLNWGKKWTNTTLKKSWKPLMRVLLFCRVNNVLQMTERSSRSQVWPSIESWMCPIASAATLCSTEVMIQTQRQGIALASCQWIRTFQNKIMTAHGLLDCRSFQQCYNYRWIFPV